jgi:DNA invertase Pin-like site-specific DNA recombinase
MKIGYARVSTDDQNPNLQIAALSPAHIAGLLGVARSTLYAALA